jgi:hypothetical protein
MKRSAPAGLGRDKSKGSSLASVILWRSDAKFSDAIDQIKSENEPEAGARLLRGPT